MTFQRLIAGVVLGLSACFPSIAGAQALDAVRGSVVSVLPTWPPDVKRSEEPEGSGVAVLDGATVVTALHIVDRATSIRIRTAKGRIVPAKLVGLDRATDIAILSIDTPLPPLSLASEDPALGQPVCAVGNAFGLGLSVTCGVVSGVHRAGMGFNVIEDFVQTDAAVNPGASGGALVT
ncbi:MAG: S1C family serine protease, partial [Methyloligellaceae bacterium]